MVVVVVVVGGAGGGGGAVVMVVYLLVDQVLEHVCTIVFVCTLVYDNGYGGEKRRRVKGGRCFAMRLLVVV